MLQTAGMATLTLPNPGTATQLVAWLQSCNCESIRPCRVTIEEQTWLAAWYRKTLNYSADMDACRWGERKAGDPYTVEMVYCIGPLPKSYAKGHVCYPNSGEDWYVASYMPLKNLTPAVAEFHPFGVSFQLAPWRVPGGEAIDKWEQKPYRRIPLSVEWL